MSKGGIPEEGWGDRSEEETRLHLGVDGLAASPIRIRRVRGEDGVEYPNLGEGYVEGGSLGEYLQVLRGVIRRRDKICMLRGSFIPVFDVIETVTDLEKQFELRAVFPGDFRNSDEYAEIVQECERLNNQRESNGDSDSDDLSKRELSATGASQIRLGVRAALFVLVLGGVGYTGVSLLRGLGGLQGEVSSYIASRGGENMDAPIADQSLDAGANTTDSAILVVSSEDAGVGEDAAGGADAGVAEGVRASVSREQKVMGSLSREEIEERRAILKSIRGKYFKNKNSSSGR